MKILDLILEALEPIKTEVSIKLQRRLKWCDVQRKLRAELYLNSRTQLYLYGVVIKIRKPQYKCGCYSCPVCRTQHIRRRKNLVLKEFGKIKADDMRLVSINGDICSSMSEVEAQHKAMKNQIGYLCKKTLAGVRAYALLEVIWKDGGFFPHWHVIMGGNVDDLIAKLKPVFPLRRQVNVENLYSLDKVKEIDKVKVTVKEIDKVKEVKNIVGYSCKRTLDDFNSFPSDKRAELLIWIRENKGLKTFCFVRGKAHITTIDTPILTGTIGTVGLNPSGIDDRRVSDPFSLGTSSVLSSLGIGVRSRDRS